jgi:hypothetical protein
MPSIFSLRIRKTLATPLACVLQKKLAQVLNLLLNYVDRLNMRYNLVAVTLYPRLPLGRSSPPSLFLSFSRFGERDVRETADVSQLSASWLKAEIATSAADVSQLSALWLKAERAQSTADVFQLSTSWLKAEPMSS